MFNKLAYRNMKKSAGDYVIYLITMSIVVSLMLAFNSIMFCPDIKKLCAMGGFMALMLAFASIFIMLIISWLIHYIVRFMMEKRSREFGTYLLLGIKKKQVAELFIKENSILASIAFLLGIIPGILIQQLLNYFFNGFFNLDYKISSSLQWNNLFFTFILYSAIFLFSLIRNKKYFYKMNIHDLMYMERQNEQFESKNIGKRQYLFFAALLYDVIFVSMMFFGKITTSYILFWMIGLIIACYIRYFGFADFLMVYIGKKNRRIFRGSRLFLLRQLSSKIKTMSFTMGTLTVFFTTALVVCSIAVMFNDYLKQQLNYQLPFDIIMFSDQIHDDFSEELAIIEEKNTVLDKLIYNIYEVKTDDYKQCILKHSGKNIKDNAGKGDQATYFKFDTYMRVSDYNALRQMLGLEPVKLADDHYLLHTKSKAADSFRELIKKGTLEIMGRQLSFEGIHTEGFSQNGINGADYVIVVPDDIAESMNPYYSLLAVDIIGNSTEDLYAKLCAVNNYKDKAGKMTCRIIWGHGSDDFVTCTNTTQVRTPQMNEIKFVLTSISYPAIYIAIVFVCVAFTILSIQQLGDIGKNRYRYGVLKKLGLGQKEVNGVILKQLGAFFLCPIIVSLVIGTFFILFIGNYFVYYTGIKTSAFIYYGITVVIFLSIFSLYFMATYYKIRKAITISKIDI